MKLRIQGVKESRIQEVVGLAAILFDNILSHIPKFGLVLDAPRFVKRKEPDCPAIILFRYSDCEASGFPRTRTTTEHEEEASISEFRFKDSKSILPRGVRVARRLAARLLTNGAPSGGPAGDRSMI